MFGGGDDGLTVPAVDSAERLLDAGAVGTNQRAAVCRSGARLGEDGALCQTPQEVTSHRLLKRSVCKNV